MDTIVAGAQETILQARLVAIPREVLFEGCLSPQVKITLQQLAALAEDNPWHATPPLTFPRLADLTRLSASTLRGHLAILRAYRSAIRLQRAGRGCFTLVLADWLFLPLPGRPQEQISQPVPQAISPARSEPSIPADEPTPPEPAGALPVQPQTGRDSFPAETAQSECSAKTTTEDVTHPSGRPLTAPPVSDAADPIPSRINILINPINQEEEVGPVKKATEGLPPPPNHYINTPIARVEPPVSPALPKSRSKATGKERRPAAPPRAARHAGHARPNAPPSKKAGTQANAASPPARLSPAVRQALEDSGVFSTLFSEVAHTGWSDEELLALLAWCRADNPRKPGGLFMVRLRSGLKPPESYYHPPCPTCGLTGGEHADDCSQRYISGPYASFVKH